jgi:hypothetical protein
MLQCCISRIQDLQIWQTLSSPKSNSKKGEQGWQGRCKDAISKLVRLPVQIVFAFDARTPKYIPIPMQMLSR